MSTTISESIVFKNGNSLAIRLVGDCKLPQGTRVKETREGARIIIEPISDGWSSSFLKTLGGWNEEIVRPNGVVLDPFE